MTRYSEISLKEKLDLNAYRTRKRFEVGKDGCRSITREDGVIVIRLNDGREIEVGSFNYAVRQREETGPVDLEERVRQKREARQQGKSDA